MCTCFSIKLCDVNGTCSFHHFKGTCKPNVDNVLVKVGVLWFSILWWNETCEVLDCNVLCILVLCVYGFSFPTT
jgi:hypothetical protein